MANLLNGYLNNVAKGATNPKGTLGDFQHAAKLYNSNSFALAPKTKFLYHVVLDINQAAIKSSNFNKDTIPTIALLVKSVDLPGFKITTDTVHQYNRKKQIQTGISYDSVNIVFHDDNSGLTSLLWALYYGYYYADGTQGLAGYNRTAYKNSSHNKYNYGLDNNSSEPFFNTIQIYQLSRQQYQSFTLVKPIITGWQHEKLDQADTASTSANTMVVAYESVIYGAGQVKEDSPAGFATNYYDKTPSPLTVAGGGTRSLLGRGGVVDGAVSVLGDIFDKDKKITLGTLIKGVNTVKNFKNLGKGAIKGELQGLAANIGGNLLISGVGALAGAVKDTVAQRIEDAKSSSFTEKEINKLSGNTAALSSILRKAYGAGLYDESTQVTEENLLQELKDGKNLKLNAIARSVKA